jgi:hypothetical protein
MKPIFNLIMNKLIQNTNKIKQEIDFASKNYKLYLFACLDENFYPNLKYSKVSHIEYPLMKKSFHWKFHKSILNSDKYNESTIIYRYILDEEIYKDISRKK